MIDNWRLLNEDSVDEYCDWDRQDLVDRKKLDLPSWVSEASQ